MRGDAVSLSHLGGQLRSQADQLATDALAVRAAASVCEQVLHLDAVATAMDRAGSVLQDLAVQVARTAAERRTLADDVLAAGLVLNQWSVEEPFGVTDIEQATRRRRLLPGLQSRSHRLHTADARARSEAQRVLADCAQRLSRLATVSSHRTPQH